MGKLKCVECNSLAQVIVKKKAYCNDCASKLEEPAIVEETPAAPVAPVAPIVIVKTPKPDLVVDKIGPIKKRWWKKD